MKRPIDSFKGKSKEEIDEKESLLDEDNLEKYDRLALFLAAVKVFGPVILVLLIPIILMAIFF